MREHKQPRTILDKLNNIITMNHVCALNVQIRPCEKKYYRWKRARMAEMRTRATLVVIAAAPAYLFVPQAGGQIGMIVSEKQQ